ncbi:MAG: hypothetical protein ACRDP6_16070 [Actinoallomurus sp.]
MLMLLTREIPYKTGVCAMPQQPHATTLKNTTDTSRRERRFLPGPKAEGPTPRER